MIEISHSPQETKKFAQKLAKKLQGGEVLGLVGELGAGKTVFVQGLAKTLGIKEIVNSPTFILMKKYQIPIAPGAANLKHLIHIDAYRLESFNQLRGIGVEEYFNRRDCIVVVEWADKVKKIKNYQKYIEIIFKEGKDQEERIMEFYIKRKSL